MAEPTKAPSTDGGASSDVPSSATRFVPLGKASPSLCVLECKVVTNTNQRITPK